MNTLSIEQRMSFSVVRLQNAIRQIRNVHDSICGMGFTLGKMLDVVFKRADILPQRSQYSRAAPADRSIHKQAV